MRTASRDCLKPLLSLLAAFLALACLALACLGLACPAYAAAQQPGNPASHELTVATRAAPPFAMKGPDGQWQGLAIGLWRDIAREHGYTYHFVETDLAGMIDGVADGRYDASVGALTVTSAREKKVDFTHPFIATGFGIAVHKSPTAWMSLLRNFFTVGFLKAVLALSALLLVVGFLFWLAERKHNSEEFADSSRGIWSGFWFSAVTMTTVGYGDKAPRTAAGKAIALVWMFAAILIISTFTGMIASSLTTDRITGAIGGPDDLHGAAVGSIRGSASDDWLASEGIAFSGYPDVPSGLAALESGRIDAFVYDEPLLRYRVRTGDSHDIRMLPGSFGRQDYAIATGPGSPLREAIDISLLKEVESPQWRDNLQRVLGKRD